jgi:hypothetical protein
MRVRHRFVKRTASAASGPGSRRVNAALVTVVVCIALGAVAAATASLNVALPSLARSTGALGIAVIGSIVTAVYRSNLHLPGVPPAQASQARDSFAIALHAGGRVKAAASTAFEDGIDTGLRYAAAAALIAVITVAVLLPRGRRRRDAVRADQPEPAPVTRLTDLAGVTGPERGPQFALEQLA